MCNIAGCNQLIIFILFYVTQVKLIKKKKRKKKTTIEHKHTQADFKRDGIV